MGNSNNQTSIFEVSTVCILDTSSTQSINLHLMHYINNVLDLVPREEKLRPISILNNSYFRETRSNV